LTNVEDQYCSQCGKQDVQKGYLCEACKKLSRKKHNQNLAIRHKERLKNDPEFRKYQHMLSQQRYANMPEEKKQKMRERSRKYYAEHRDEQNKKSRAKYIANKRPMKERLDEIFNNYFNDHKKVKK